MASDKPVDLDKLKSGEILRHRLHHHRICHDLLVICYSVVDVQSNRTCLRIAENGCWVATSAKGLNAYCGGAEKGRTGTETENADLCATTRVCVGNA